ncbi:DMT family transporter [Vogesella sp. LIG4]|uniref:DMT family transporter n=1 Tax=Vogesella sp. LIG4 TaxID=1192162 RepID=UPI0008201328|nr:DMT family transporter [Vogesella sp. LIG4]SCK22548.1 EamA domain-containing membrane protein RarD [Vogesella sp. LIG4]
MKHLAYAAFLLLGLIWGSNFLYMKWAAVWLSPAQIVLLRVLFGFVPILLLALARGVLSWSQLRQLPHFIAMALLATAVYYYAFAAGTARLPSGIAGMLSGAIPLFSFVTAWLFLREEPLNRRTVGGLLLGFVGVLLIARPWAAGSIDLHGVLYMVLGSLSVGSSFVYARRFLAGKGYSPLALSTWQTGLALLMLLAVTDLHGMGGILQDGRALAGLVLGLGLLGTGLAYVLYYCIVQQLGALRAAGVTYIPPLVALAIGSMVAHETLQTAHLLAVLCILGGVFLLQTGKAAGSVSSR